MDIVELGIILVVAGGLGGAVVVTVLGRKLKQLGRRLESTEAKRQQQKANAEHYESLLEEEQAKTAHLERLLAEHVELHGERDTTGFDLAERLREAVEEAKEQEKRSLRYFGCIERIEKQRNYWQKCYHTQARSHSAAQAMMMREIDRLCRRLHGYERDETGTERTKIDPKLLEAQKKFFEEHVDPGTEHADPPPDPPALAEADRSPS